MENYFYDALHNFIFEEAGGGAIRHLADRGYTAKQTADALSFPMPYEKVREAYTRHLLERGVLLAESPAEHKWREKTEYVREYDRYGKPSFRRVVVSEDAFGGAQEGKSTGAGRGNPPDKRAGGKQGELRGKTTDAGEWKEMEIAEFLSLYKEGTGEIRLSAESEHKEAERNIYIACNFGMDGIEKRLQDLDGRQQEYIRGICWRRRTMYHLLDRRMLEIAVKLWEAERIAGDGMDIIGKVFIYH